MARRQGASAPATTLGKKLAARRRSTTGVPRRSPAKRSARKTSSGPALPTREAVLEFIQSSPDRVGKREIARAFQVKGADRIELKRLLKEMAEDGLITSPRKRIARTDTLPSVAVIEMPLRRGLPQQFRSEGEPAVSR